MSNTIPVFTANAIEQMSRVLGEAVTGGEIEPILRQCRIAERPAESNTKWGWIRSTLLGQQKQDQCANAICLFITSVMDPVRFVDRPDEFESLRDDLNKTLAFSGLSLNQRGTTGESFCSINLKRSGRGGKDPSSQVTGVKRTPRSTSVLSFRVYTRQLISMLFWTRPRALPSESGI